MTKVKNLDEIKQITASLKSKGEQIVFTNGCFDILHAGHIKLLKEARSCGDVLIVGLNTDSSARRIKGPSRPVNKQEDRAEVLSAISYVDYIVFFNEDTSLPLIKEIKPDVLVKGSEYAETEVVGHDFVKSYGGKVHLIKQLKGVSTTAIINNQRL